MRGPWWAPHLLHLQAPAGIRAGFSSARAFVRPPPGVLPRKCSQLGGAVNRAPAGLYSWLGRPGQPGVVRRDGRGGEGRAGPETRVCPEWTAGHRPGAAVVKFHTAGASNHRAPLSARSGGRSLSSGAGTEFLQRVKAGLVSQRRPSRPRPLLAGESLQSLPIFTRVLSLCPNCCFFFFFHYQSLD